MFGKHYFLDIASLPLNKGFQEALKTYGKHSRIIYPYGNYKREIFRMLVGYMRVSSEIDT